MTKAAGAFIAVGIAVIMGCGTGKPFLAKGSTRATGTPSAPTIKTAGVAAKIVEGARRQLVQPAGYDGRYRKISYPGGDVASDRGVCTDVVIRSLRHAGYDLQKLIHEDMKLRFKTYPRREARPDPNIDHRRVPNQRHFFAKFGKSLTLRTDGTDAKEWLPGDIVTWKLDSGLDHTGVLSDSIGSGGLPQVIHNIGVCSEEDVLTTWEITGHYRFPP